MKLLAVHTVPVWEEPNGQHTLGIEHRDPHPPVVGWANVAAIVISGEPRWFLLTLDATR